MNDPITQKWKDETMLQAKALADRMWKGRIMNLMDKYHRSFETADYLIMKQSENNVYGLIDDLRLE